MGIITGILILSLMMLIHELGHYITGRILGFKIIEFSIFMGPVVFSKTSKKTGIKYSLKLLPIGASVRFVGEEDMGEEASADPDSFNEKAIWKRAVVLITGPGVNIISGILALTILFSSIGFVTTKVSETEKNSQASIAGIMPGEKVVELNGVKINTSVDFAMEMSFIPEENQALVKLKDPKTKEIRDVTMIPEKKTGYFLGITINMQEEEGGLLIIDVDPNSNEGSPVLKEGDILLDVEGFSMLKDNEKTSKIINDSKGNPVKVRILRDDKEIIVTPKPMIREHYSPRGIYFEPDEGFLVSVQESFKYTVSIIKLTFKSLAKIFTGKIAAKDSLSGPVGVVNLIGSTVNADVPFADKMADLLWMFALISLNLGVFNLLPIPALDGSHLLLLGVEKIRGKRLSNKVQSIIVVIGFALIIGLAIMGLTFDIMRILGK